MLKVSASRLKTFLNCRYQYWCKYVLKLPDPSGDKANLGSAIHTILECVERPGKNRSQLVLEGRKSGEVPKSLWRQWTLLKARYKLETAFDKDAKKLILNGLLYAIDLKAKVLQVEGEFDIPLDNNISLKGYIDKTLLVGNKLVDTQDYKTGVPYKEDVCNSDPQGFIYMWAMKKLYPQYPQHVFTFQFLKNNTSITISKTQKQIDAFIRFVGAQGYLMDRLTREEALCQKSWKCNMCKFKNAIPSHNYKGCPAQSY